ncbi:MAG: DEAD/DEAH box helicase [Sphingobacteriales bacterium]|nr:MAG: DEAD/DEAH box helicase [Sphingobacteriales bacterium]
MLKLGLYEQLITTVISKKLGDLDRDQYFIHTSALDPAEASRYLSLSLTETIRFALNQIKDDNRPIQQIELANRIIEFLATELPDTDFSENLIDTEGKILDAVLSNLDSGYADLAARVREIMPYTRLSQSELFTGSNAGISLESELKKEILSADEICWLVSFIKFSAVRIFAAELEEYTKAGKKLKIITTSYMGATEVKAIEFLARLPNTSIKISYNTTHERLHAKAYLFLRNSGFNTGYIGSSNLSLSALTKGLEWNLKVTSKEIHHIIDKCEKTFETYWEDKDFEEYVPDRDKEKLHRALNKEKTQDRSGMMSFFDLKPFSYQSEILEKLQSERQIHNRFRNLVVAATGTGKTVISAFDYKAFKNSNDRSRLLFVAHRQEILKQAQQTYQHVLRDANFGELWVDGQVPSNFEYVFASVQTLKNQIKTISLSETFYDYIVIDEVHHITADSYRPILAKFSPKVLLGLTATPERADGGDVLNDFARVIAAEIRLPEALNRQLLCPFQYFALSDKVDLSQVSWTNGRYEISELTRIYTENDRRVSDILSNCEKYLTDINNVRALGFCASIDHAKFMAEKFIRAGLKAAYLTSDNSEDRVAIRFLGVEVKNLPTSIIGLRTKN